MTRISEDMLINEQTNNRNFEFTFTNFVLFTNSMNLINQNQFIIIIIIMIMINLPTHIQSIEQNTDKDFRDEEEGKIKDTNEFF